MSLTSYRAAPPRAKARKGPCVDARKEGSDLGGSGDDLLSRVLRHSTMGAEAFNGRVRDGIGFGAPRLDHRTGQDQTASTGASPGSFSRRTGVFTPRRASSRPERAGITRAIKPIERLVPVSSTRRRAYTPGLSTWSSSTALKGVLVSRGVSRLDAFSGYPGRT